MNEKDVLGAFSLVNNPIVLSEEETKDVQKAIKQLQEENKKQKYNWNMLKEWLEKSWEESQDIWFVKIINKMQELEQGDDNDE